MNIEALRGMGFKLEEDKTRAHMIVKSPWGHEIGRYKL